MKVEQVLICSRRTSHCWVLCHPEVPVGALPWSGDRISCSCWSTGQSCPMTVHHLPAQLHLSIWTGCCWLLCHHLLPGTSLFSVKRRSSSLQGKLGSWSRSPTWKKSRWKNVWAQWAAGKCSLSSIMLLWSLTLPWHSILLQSGAPYFLLLFSLPSKDVLFSSLIPHQKNTRKSEFG